MKLPSFEQSTVGYLRVSASSFAQDVRIHGKVVDEYTKEPIPMVNVFVRGSSIGAMTDSSGVFSLSLVAEKKVVVSFSHIGYLKQS